LEPGDAAALDDATTVGVDLTGAVLPAVREAQVEGSDLGRVRAVGGAWERVTLADCRLDGADLANVVWRGGSLLRCSLREVRMTGAQLSGLRCRDVRLRGCRLDGVGGVAGLRGARIAEEDALALLPALARELGITIGG